MFFAINLYKAPYVATYYSRSKINVFINTTIPIQYEANIWSESYPSPKFTTIIWATQRFPLK